MVLSSTSWLKRGMVYNGPVLCLMVETKEWFTMVLSSGSWLKIGMIYHGPVPLFMVKDRMVYHGPVFWFMVEERNGLPWSCLLAHC